jgi:hypothetical protein
MKNQYCNVQFYSKGIYGIIEDSIYLGKKYTYYNRYNYKLKVGDNVIAHVNHEDVAIGKVVEIFNAKDYNTYSDCKQTMLKDIIGIANVSNIQENNKKERRLAELEDQIEEMYKKISKLQILESMSKDNKDMQDLLKEYKELTKD